MYPKSKALACISHQLATTSNKRSNYAVRSTHSSFFEKYYFLIVMIRILTLTAILARSTEAFTPGLHISNRLNFAQVYHSHPLSSISASTSSLKMSSSPSEEKKRVLVPIAEASEEIETSSITDVLTRYVF